MIAFLLAFLYELLYLLWLYCADSGRALLSALFSMAVGALSFYAISNVIHDESQLPYLLAGYGAGSYVSGMMKAWMDDK